MEFVYLFYLNNFKSHYSKSYKNLLRVQWENQNYYNLY